MKSYEKETSKAVGNPVDDSAASDSDEDEDTCSDVKVDGLEDSDKNSNSAVIWDWYWRGSSGLQRNDQESSQEAEVCEG